MSVSVCGVNETFTNQKKKMKLIWMFNLLVVLVCSELKNSTNVVRISNTTTEVPNSQGHGVPGNPTDVVASAYDTKAQVSWSPPKDDGSDTVLEYEVATFLRQDDNALPGSVVLSSSSENTTPMSYTIVGNLINGESYSFKVRAKNVNGYSAWSARSDSIIPLHPPDLCTHVTCSGNGFCFPNYDDNTSGTKAASCICHAKYQKSEDCSVKDEGVLYEYVVKEWSECSSGCGGGQRTRHVVCMENNKQIDMDKCSDMVPIKKKPVGSEICNTMSCGSTIADVTVSLDMSYREVLFSHVALSMFKNAFITEVTSALDIDYSRISISSLKRGSIIVKFRILPATTDSGKSVNAAVETLQSQLEKEDSKLRTMGTFARRIDPETFHMTFSVSEEASAGQDEDISVGGLLGTVCVLVTFISLFAWYLRKRHERILAAKGLGHRKVVIKRDLKPMGIRTMM